MSRTEIVIERLVLEGLELSPSEGAALAVAIETALVDVFGGTDRDGTRVHDTGPRSSATAARTSADLGRDAALAIHRSVYR